MGHRFTVGEAKLYSEPLELSVWIQAEVVYRDDTPFEAEEHRANWCDCGYVDFTRWACQVGLYELFYGTGWNSTLREYDVCPDGFHRDEPLLKGHGAPAMICQADLDMIRAAIDRNPATGPVTFQEGGDTKRAYLVWFAWWFEWALTNCQTPIIWIH